MTLHMDPRNLVLVAGNELEQRRRVAATRHQARDLRVTGAGRTRRPVRRPGRRPADG